MFFLTDKNSSFLFGNVVPKPHDGARGIAVATDGHPEGTVASPGFGYSGNAVCATRSTLTRKLTAARKYTLLFHSGA